MNLLYRQELVPLFTEVLICNKRASFANITHALFIIEYNTSGISKSIDVNEKLILIVYLSQIHLTLERHISLATKTKITN